MIIDEQLGIEAWISYNDFRYPTLVLRSDKFGLIGYDLNPSTGNLQRVCICAAHSETECCCGAWSIVGG